MINLITALMSKTGKMGRTTEEVMVSIFNKFVDWKKRKLGENNFISNQLNRFGCKSVFDLALGGGYDSIELIKKGFDVVSNEYDDNFLNLGLQNARLHDIELRTTQYDWKQTPQELFGQFDAAILLGNSFIYMRTEEDQFKSLTNFYNLVNKILIIDHRNFEYIIKNKNKILENRNNFKYTKKINYCGDAVDGYPIEIDLEKKRILFEYLEKETGKKGYILHYPLFEDEMKRLLLMVGFNRVETYYDYKKERPGHYDFVQHVGVK